MINKKYLKNLRCKVINNKNDFIFNCSSKIIEDSLDIIRLNFQNILILGDEDVAIHKYIKKKFKNSKIKVYNFNNINLNNSLEKINEIDLINIEMGKYDLIISNIMLSLSDNLENLLQKIIDSLVPNGFFLAMIPSPDNFYLLKSAMIKTDIEIYGGAYNRFNKLIDLQEIIKFLKKYNYKNTSVNLEKIKLEYQTFDKLLLDVRSMNLSYYHDDKKKTFEKKNYFERLEKNFIKNKNNNFDLTANFYLVSGWKDHSSQQKPLKPGQAKNKLNDFL